MTRRTRFIIAICLIAQSFTTLILSFVYSDKKKDLSRAFLGLGIAGGLGGAYLLYTEYKESKKERLAFDNADWCADDCDCCEGDFFENIDEADEINFTIADEPAADAQ
jgi:hypothetical protein